MSYKQLKLQEVAIPEDSAIKKNTEWRYERAFGVGLYIQHIADEEHLPYEATLCNDRALGMKYGVWMQKDGPMRESGRFRQFRSQGEDDCIYQQAVIRFEIYKQTERHCVTDVLMDRLAEAGVVIEDSLDNSAYEDKGNIILIWTTRREQYNTILKVVSETIEQVAKAVYVNEDDRIPEVNEATVIQLKKVKPKKKKIYECNGKVYDTLEEMYWDVANHVLPKLLSEGIVQAMEAYVETGIAAKAEAEDDYEITCRLEVEKGNMVFKRKRKVFFTFPCELLPRVRKWLFALKYVLGQEASHWLNDAMDIAARKGAFYEIESICILGECGGYDMDVVYEG